MRSILLGLVLCLSVAATACGSSDDPSGGGGSGGGNGGSGGSGASGGSGGGGGSGGSGGDEVCVPLDGEPLDVPEGVWTWVDIEGARCRDGSPTGVGVYRNPEASRLVIYLQGGGACFNVLSCSTNRQAFDGDDFRTVPLNGVLNLSDTNNPLADSSFIYVPYCTGDVHAGSAEGVDVFGGLEDQAFVGHDNIGLALRQIVPTFGDVEQVVLTGESAGGFGTWLNYEQVSEAFCREDVVLLDDSGPPQSAPYLATCLQDRWRALWGLDETLPADCTACAPDQGGVTALASHIAETYPDGRFGLISSTEDSTISLFFAFGVDDCADLGGSDFPDTVKGTEAFKTGLIALRDEVFDPAPNMTTYFIEGTQHTWIGRAGWETTSVGESLLVDWVSALVEGPTPEAVGP